MASVSSGRADWRVSFQKLALADAAFLGHDGECFHG
jgi:hypothetical protein